MHDNENISKENKNRAKDKTEPQHLQNVKQPTPASSNLVGKGLSRRPRSLRSGVPFRN